MRCAALHSNCWNAPPLATGCPCRPHRARFETSRAAPCTVLQMFAKSLGELQTNYQDMLLLCSNACSAVLAAAVCQVVDGAADRLSRHAAAVQPNAYSTAVLAADVCQVPSRAADRLHRHAAAALPRLLGQPVQRHKGRGGHVAGQVGQLWSWLHAFRRSGMARTWRGGHRRWRARGRIGWGRGKGSVLRKCRVALPGPWPSFTFPHRCHVERHACQALLLKRILHSCPGPCSWFALEQLVREGKLRAAGVSNFNLEQVCFGCRAGLQGNAGGWWLVAACQAWWIGNRASSTTSRLLLCALCTATDAGAGADRGGQAGCAAG